MMFINSIRIAFSYSAKSCSISLHVVYGCVVVLMVVYKIDHLCLNVFCFDKGKGICLESIYPCDHMFFRLYLPWQREHSSLQLLIQPWICAPGTHYGWDRGSVEYEVCPTLQHVASTGNRTPDLLILSPMLYPLSHMLP